MRNAISMILLFMGCMPLLPVFSQVFPFFNSSMRSVNQIPLPIGFERVEVGVDSFSDYLRNLPLRKDKSIYLYTKKIKADQTLHYAVIDLSTGEKDLQQCADVIMRLRAEYFYHKKMYDSIRFPGNPYSDYVFSNFIKAGVKDPRETFMRYMERVFINCGTYTLHRQLKRVPDFATIQIGDVLLKAGAPGHAEIVVDVAINRQTGKKIFLLLQGYMPAQDIHILLNPVNRALGPWYEVNDRKEVITSSWIFTKDQLKRW